MWDENIPGLTEGSRRKTNNRKKQRKRENRMKGDSVPVKEKRGGIEKVEQEERKIYDHRARSKGANKVLQSAQIYRLRNQWENQFVWTWLVASGNASDQIL